MNKQLNSKQRKFLVYLKDNHKWLGYTHNLSKVLMQGSYNEDQLRFTIKPALEDFKELVKGNNLYIVEYGKPTKYLK